MQARVITVSEIWDMSTVTPFSREGPVTVVD